MIDEEKILSGDTDDPYLMKEENLNDWDLIRNKYFRHIKKGERDLSGILKDASKLCNYSLPKDINELFLNIDEAPAYWLTETKLNLYIQKFIRNHLPPTGDTDQAKYVKNFYSKWLLFKSKEEKKYFASSIINFSERTANKNNFYAHTLCGMIYTYDQQFLNYSKALELFNKADKIITSIRLDEYYKDETEYMVLLFSGFTSIKNDDYESAKNYFLNALMVKPGGISAKFHLALIETKLNHFESAESLLKELLQFDMQRTKYAIEIFNLPLADYFINNSIISRILFYPDFAAISFFIDNFFNSIVEANSVVLILLKQKLDAFILANRKFNFPEEYTERIFLIEQLISRQEKHNDIIFLNNLPRLDREFNALIKQTIKSIKDKNYSEIENKLSSFDSDIAKRTSFIEELTTEFEKNKTSFISNLEKNIKTIEKKISFEINIWEERINNIGNESKLNPKNSFNRMMTYNTILSFLSSLMGGCAGYSGSSVIDVVELKSLLSVIVVSGVKWGLITFAIGFILSSGAAAYTFAEKVNRKKTILRKISSLKNEKENKINELRKEAALKEKKLQSNFNDEIEKNKIEVQNLSEERENLKKKLTDETNKQIEEEINSLETLINPNF